MQKSPFVIHIWHVLLVMLCLFSYCLVWTSTPESFFFCDDDTILCFSAMLCFSFKKKRPKFRVVCLCLFKFIFWDFAHYFRLLESFFGIWFYPLRVDFIVSGTTSYQPTWLTYLFCLFFVYKTVPLLLPFFPTCFLSGRLQLVLTLMDMYS